MSALNDDIGGKLNVLVDVPRAMSPSEVNDYLLTGVMPNLSQSPPEEFDPATLRPLGDMEARMWLGSLTASGKIGESVMTERRVDVRPLVVRDDDDESVLVYTCDCGVLDETVVPCL